MKKKLVLTMLTVCLATTVGGCAADKTVIDSDTLFESIETTQAEDVSTESTVEESTIEESATKESTTEEKENMTVESQLEEAADLTFADLSKRRFEFCSGAGGWSEEFIIEKDGSFRGNFHDSDMGDTGEGYDEGTFYCCSYSGHFTDITKINNYTYEMKLADITYNQTVDTSEISENTRYIYTDSYCLGGTDTFTVYLPGTPLSELSQEVRNWLSLVMESETELTMIAIVDKTNEYGIYSVERPEPLEEAMMTFNSYKESYDYYGELLKEAVTTVEMVECTGNMYEVSDKCLNEIWSIIRYNVEEEEFEKILTEQRAWIAEKEAKAQESSAEYEGGSFAAVDYNDILATLTIERCEELIEYLK